MEGLLITFGAIAVCAVAINIWISTKNGKKWLEQL